MKKILFTVILALVVVLLFAFLGVSGCKTTAAETTAAEPYKVVFTNAFYSAPYCAPMSEAAQDEAEKLGIELTILDGKADGQVQLDQIQSAISQKVDGIIYFPADMASSASGVKLLAESNIPFLIINSRADPSVDDLVPVFLGPDYRTQGEVAGQMALDVLGEEGGNIVAIEGAGGTEGSTKRSEGFYDTVLTNPNVEILAKQQADWDPAKAQTIMEDYIVKFGDQIDLLFALDDGMWAGAIKAIKDNGLLDQIISVSIGSNKAVVDGVRSGECYGSASQNPMDEGRLGIVNIIKLIDGETLEKWIKIPSDPITSETVGDIQGW